MSTGRTTTARRWTKIVTRHSRRRLRARDPRRHEAQGPAVPRHGDRHLRLVRRRRAWQSLRLDLPVTPVHGIAVKGDDLVIAHARPIVLHHGQHLRAAADRRGDDQRAAGAVQSGDAMRSVSRGVVDRLLPEGRRPTKCTIDILDAQGKLIRSYTGTPQPPRRRRGRAAETQKTRAAPPPPPRSAVKQGMNRFTWDMRYPDARTFPG